VTNRGFQTNFSPSKDLSRNCFGMFSNLPVSSNFKGLGKAIIRREISQFYAQIFLGQAFNNLQKISKLKPKQNSFVQTN